MTTSLVKLLEQAYLLSPAWVKTYQPVIIPELPTDQMDIGYDVVGIYLYHTLEKKEYGNFPLPGKDLPTSRHLSMALTLYYQLTARHYSDVPDGSNAYDEQLLMSIAMKALHDYPFLDDSSTINSIKIFQGDLPDNQNRLKIFQQPIGSNEAVHNWTAGPAPMRWSAYYEVATVFLEPEEISSYSGRVLTYGNYVFTMGAPRITLSQNILPYYIPGDPSPREIKVQPAQAPASGALLLPESVVNFFGSGFTGDGLVLRLYHSRWTMHVIAAPTWSIGVQTDRLTMTIRETAIEEISGAVMDVLPGVYAVEVVVKRNMELPGGQVRVVSNSSNKFP
ncbi:Pvc16 family protein [Hymenobacter volaticus]|uniref:DUF4255 domain-containing protein n=1 Tax=Hymenobacter volaticus TaxID=2932254 RepID=A0ABY4G1Z6_9BACT|nr:Pvc16 family protein [Hymenobacter volaticus]UOQ64822.1 DUF4255 domain-containing protein [Hymenobacter volaticus]